MSDSSLTTPGEPTHSGSGPVNNNSGPGTQINYTLAGGVGNTQYNAQNQTIYQTATSITDAEKIAHCRNALLTTRPEDDREALISAKGKKVDGTCEWIWANAEFQSLLRGETRLLWICGGPGKGKTMISIHLTQELEKAQQMIYYFCRADDDRRRTATHVIRGLVWHLATKQPDLAEHLLHHLYAPEQNKEKEKEKLQLLLESREALWSLLLGMTRDTRLRTTFCLVDGLDECDEDSQQWLAAKLIQFNQESRGHNLRTIIVSRPSVVLLKKNNQIKLDPDNDFQINVDLRAFVSARTRNLSELLDFSTQFREHVENTLLNRAEGTFLWLGLAIPELLKKRNWTEVETALQSLPRGLPALYDRMILQIPEQDIHFSSMILRWVTLAVRPLSVEELGEVLQCRKSTAISKKQMVRDRISTCGSLVQIKNDIVSLVHESARDYFLRDEVSDIRALEQFRIQPLEVHLEIACMCLAAIEKNRQELRSACEDSLRSERRFDYLAVWPISDDPLLNYAIFHWPDHVRQARQDFNELCKHAPYFFAEKSQLLLDWCVIFHWEDRFWFGNEPWGSTSALSVACYLGIVAWVRKLLTAARGFMFRRVANQKDNTGRRPLQYAACGNRASVMGILIEHGANVNGSDRARWTALLLAITYGNTAAVRMLLDYGASTRDYGCLHNATRSDNTTVLGLLLDQNTDIEVVDRSGRTALHCAISEGKTAPARLLLDRGSCAKAKDHNLWTPLHGALSATFFPPATKVADASATHGNTHTPPSYGEFEEIVRLLIERGADIQARDVGGQTPLHRMRPWATSCAAILLDHGADIEARDCRQQTPLHHAVCLGDNERNILLLIDRGANLEAKDVHGGTPLHHACQFYGSARLLLSHNADANARTAFRETPLHLAAYMGGESLARLLFDHHADANARNSSGQTPLHLAAYVGDDDLARLLLHHHADVNAQDMKGSTPLHVLADRSGIRPFQMECIAERLLAYGANCKSTNKKGCTPSQIAATAKLKNRSLIKLLSEASG